MMAGVADWKGWRIVSVVLLLLVVAYLVHFAVTRPAWEWDAVFYTMAVFRDGTPDAVALHGKAWALVEARMPRDAFDALVNASAARSAHHADAAAMVSFLPHYEVKLGYVWLLRLLAPLADPLLAMRVVALAGALGTLAVLFAAAWRTAGLVTLAWLPAVTLFGLSSLSTMLAPDPLATLLYVVAFAAVLSGRLGGAAVLLVAVPLVAVVLVRPDSVVLNLALAAALAVDSRRLAAAVAGGSLGAYALDLALSGHLGWWRQFILSFRPPPHDLAGFDPAFSLRTYLDVLREQALDVLHLPWAQAALGLVILAAVLVARREAEPGPRRAGRLLAALVVGMALRFVIYPSPELRHYDPALFGLCLVVLHAAAPAGAQRRS